jgi:hypothetical protein
MLFNVNQMLLTYEADFGLGRSGEYPEQESTGSRGYFGKPGSVAESWQRTKTDPLADSMAREL